MSRAASSRVSASFVPVPIVCHGRAMQFGFQNRQLKKFVRANRGRGTFLTHYARVTVSSRLPFTYEVLRLGAPGGCMNQVRQINYIIGETRCSKIEDRDSRLARCFLCVCDDTRVLCKKVTLYIFWTVSFYFVWPHISDNGVCQHRLRLHLQRFIYYSFVTHSLMT